MLKIEEKDYSKKERYELRKFVERELANVPEGTRRYLPKHILEQLLFETNVPYILCDDLKHQDVDKLQEIYGVDIETLKSAKFPVWSGSFLSKLDLSEVSFDNVVWSLRGFFDSLVLSGLGYFDEETYFGMYHYNMVKKENNLSTNVTNSDGSGYSEESDHIVDFSNSNARIDFSKSFCFSSKYCSSEIGISNCNFENTDFNGLSYDWRIGIIHKSNLANTGLNIVVNDNNKSVALSELSRCSIDGCFINGRSAIEELKNAESVLTEEGQRGRH